MDIEKENELVFIDVSGLSDEELIELGAINVGNPIEIGQELKNIGIPDRGIIMIMLNDYIKTRDIDIKEELNKILNIYDNEPITREFFEDSIDNIIYSSIIQAIITPDNIPTYEEVVPIINEIVLDIYMNITSPNAPKEMLNQYIAQSIEPIAFNLYAAYNMEEYNKYMEQFESISKIRREFILGYRRANTIEEKQIMQRKAAEWENLEDRDLFIEEYSNNTHIKFNTTKSINRILNTLINGTKDIRDIEVLESITPTKYIMANNKMMNALTRGQLLQGTTDLIVSSNPRKEVLTQVNINYNDDNIEIYDKDRRFTPYDRAVYNAVCSIKEAGNVNFTPNQVYRCINGLNEGEYVSPQAVGAITKSIDNSRGIYAKVNYREEAKAWGINTDKFIDEDYILSAKKTTLEAGGKEVTGYKLNSNPLLYEYAKVTGQVLTIPSELLNTKGILNSTPEVIVIREYLIRRIEVMKRKGNTNQTNKILLSTVYEELGEEKPTNKKAQRIRDIITKLLCSFESDGYVKGHKFYKEGRSFRGVEIFY